LPASVAQPDNQATFQHHRDRALAHQTGRDLGRAIANSASTPRPRAGVRGVHRTRPGNLTSAEPRFNASINRQRNGAR
jgi:hypothetical protein